MIIAQESLRFEVRWDSIFANYLTFRIWCFVVMIVANTSKYLEYLGGLIFIFLAIKSTKKNKYSRPGKLQKKQSGGVHFLLYCIAY